MKIVIAPDSFKGSLSALEVADTIRVAALRVFPEAEIALLPVADGGEGTVEALVMAAGGIFEKVSVTGPMGDEVCAVYGRIGGDTAVIEMAQASGLPLVPEGERNPLRASSRGTGELIARALASGAKKLIIGIGGSATNDGGMGMLRALGVRFLDDRGVDVPEGGAGLCQVEAVDMSGLNPAVLAAELTVICDVNNPLLGAAGATCVYGPQKGATPAMCAQLEAGMAHYARVMQAALDRDIASFEGAGAAGGMGAALKGVLGARLRRGIDAVLDTVDFDARIQDADLCVTGEGRIDGQSVRFGKVVAGIAARCSARGVPVAVIAGGMEESASTLYDVAEASIMTTINGIMPLAEAIKNARPLLLGAAERTFRFIRLGMSIQQS